jgi:phage FluMu gp28-like protein
VWNKLENLEKCFKDPAFFVDLFFNFKPTQYQSNLLRDESKRIVVVWSRQSGKTTTIALRAIWYALTHKKTLTLIIAPSLRQSMIMSDRITDFLTSLPPKYYNIFVKKLQRTNIQLSNGSRIIALPNNPQLLRGYTANQIICDEAAFFRDDALVFFNVLYPMLSTTDGILIASSTPWSKDSVFYRMCQNPQFIRHKITCEDVKNSGLVKQSFIDEMRNQIPFERFQREFMSEFVEDADAWLTQSLIINCIDNKLEYYDIAAMPKGDFHVGVDFGKEQDFSVVVVVEKLGAVIKVVHVHRFPLKTNYSSVIGYIKNLQDRWNNINYVYADITGVGGYIVEDMFRGGIRGVTGITFTIQSKEEMATILREKMRNQEIKIPYDPSRRIEEVELTSELNIEKYELLKTGHLRFSHPDGSHDDVFWSLALAVYASVQAPLPGKGVAFLPH